MIDVKQLTNIVLADVNAEDHPDYSDAYIESADYRGESLDESKLKWVNENHPEIANSMAFESLLD